MKDYLFILFILMPVQFMYGQLVPSPKYPFEYLNYHASLSEIKKHTIGLKEFSNSEKNDNQLSKYADEYIIYQGSDTVLSKHGFIILLFEKKDSTLKTVQYVISPPEAVAKNICDKLWNAISTRFGPLGKERMLPFLGKIKVWEFESSIVQLINIETGSKIITLSYSKKNKK